MQAIRAARPDSVGADAWSTASIGVAHSSEPLGDDGRALLAEADEAMYEAKRAGRSGGVLASAHGRRVCALRRHRGRP